jgi:hypothetical protein
MLPATSSVRERETGRLQPKGSRAALCGRSDVEISRPRPYARDQIDQFARAVAEDQADRKRAGSVRRR